MKNFRFLHITIYFFTRILQNEASYCDPSLCSSGCCVNFDDCLVLTDSNKDRLKNCYSGDCDIMKCGSSMCCMGGKCYDSGDENCSTITTTATTIIIVVAIIFPFFIITCIVIFLCRRRMMRNRFNAYNNNAAAARAPVGARYTISNNNPAPPPIYQPPIHYQNVNNPPREVMGSPFREPVYEEGGKSNVEFVPMPIKSVVIQQGQPYFPKEIQQGEYAIHQSHMGGAAGNQERVIGQPQPQCYDPGESYVKK